jgi:ribosomal protein S27E
MLLLDRPFEEAQLGTNAELDLRNITPNVWPVVLAQCHSTDLRLYHLTLPSLEGIERLASVRRLTLEWATKVSDLAPVYKLRHLVSLSIFDFAKLRHLDGIEALTELAELNLSGSRGALTPRLKLGSIGPVERLRGLVSFSLTNAQLEDDDITVLSRCANLRELHLSRQFERKQVAFLAKRLNAQLVEPLASYFATNLKCGTCEGNKVMFNGRRMPVLCPTCDRGRFERYVGEFERLVRDA